MTSRERVRTVLAHGIPDRIPNGLGGCETAGLHMRAYDELRALLGANPEPTRLNTFMANAVFEENDIAAMDGDILMLASPRMCGADIRGDAAGQWKAQALWGGRTYRVAVRERFERLSDGSIRWNDALCPQGGYYFDAPQPTDFFTSLEFPSPDDYHPQDDFPDAFLRRLEALARRYYESTDLCLSLGETLTDLQVQPGGYVAHLVLMKEQPDVMRAFLEKSVDASLRQLRLLHQAVGGYVDILSVAHDFGDNRGITIGPDLWRDVYKAAYLRWFQGWHDITAMAINLHSCGDIAAILPDLIECGIDVYNPVQTGQDDPSPQALKRRFGADLVFYGGAYNAQRIAASATYEEAYRHVTDNIRALSSGGGYLFAGVHNLPADMPRHHIRAMLDAYRDARGYSPAAAQDSV